MSGSYKSIDKRLPKNVQEKFIFKKAHCSVSYLQMGTRNTLNNSLKDLRDQRFESREITTNFEDIHKFCQEQSLFNVIGEWPVFE